MSILIIDEEARSRIREALRIARENPLRLAELKQLGLPTKEADVNKPLRLEDRPPGFERAHKSVAVILQRGYEACLTYEQQEVGMIKHISISSATQGMVPNVHAAKMIMEEFGMDIMQMLHAWTEEYAPGLFAVNILCMDDPDATEKVLNQGGRHAEASGIVGAEQSEGDHESLAFIVKPYGSKPQ